MQYLQTEKVPVAGCAHHNTMFKCYRKCSFNKKLIIFRNIITALLAKMNKFRDKKCQKEVFFIEILEISTSVCMQNCAVQLTFVLAASPKLDDVELLSLLSTLVKFAYAEQVLRLLH